MPQQFDPDLVAVADDLLRTDPRLRAAAALIGRLAVVVSEPKPPPKRKSRGSAKRPPPRVDVGVEGGTTTVTIGTDDAAQIRELGERLREAAEPEADEAPAAAGAPWLKVARPFVVGDSLRAVLGDRYLAGVRVDGGLWTKLRVEDRRRALALALRRLCHEERKDGSDAVRCEPPPLQCHPDTADDLSHLVAALGVDGAEGAAAVSACERLTVRGDTRSLEDKVQDLLRAWWMAGVDASDEPELAEAIDALSACMQDDDDGSGEAQEDDHV